MNTKLMTAGNSLKFIKDDERSLGEKGVNQNVKKVLLHKFKSMKSLGGALSKLKKKGVSLPSESLGRLKSDAVFDDTVVRIGDAHIAKATQDTKWQLLSDHDLARLSLKGDKEAYKAIVERYQTRLAAAARDILKNNEDAEDVVQEAFVKAYLSLNNFQFKASLYTWLYRIVYNMCIDLLRKKKRRINNLKLVGHAEMIYSSSENISVRSYDAVNDTVEYEAADMRTPVDAMLEKERNTVIKNSLNDISEDHRRVIVLREVEGMSYDEIADLIGVSKGTVMSRLHYARKRLQSVLKELQR
jgi:RNA polymerase sigma-70 factor, ECF subfamily